MDCLIEIEEAAARIEATGAYRVLRRVDHRDLEDRETCDVGFRIGLVVDVETTGVETSPGYQAQSPGGGGVQQTGGAQLQQYVTSIVM